MIQISWSRFFECRYKTIPRNIFYLLAHMKISTHTHDQTHTFQRTILQFHAPSSRHTSQPHRTSLVPLLRLFYGPYDLLRSHVETQCVCGLTFIAYKIESKNVSVRKYALYYFIDVPLPLDKIIWSHATVYCWVNNGQLTAIISDQLNPHSIWGVLC